MEETPPTQEELLAAVEAAITFYECLNHEPPEAWKVQQLLMFARMNRTVIQDVSACMEQVYAARAEKRDEFLRFS